MRFLEKTRCTRLQIIIFHDRGQHSVFFDNPAFQFCFLEPGHLGTATVLLLLAQMGKWKNGIILF